MPQFAAQTEDDPMKNIVLHATAALVMLVGVSSNALAGIPAAVPEPASLALLAAGFGGVAVIRFFGRK